MPLRFGPHAIAVLAAAMLTSTLFALIWTAATGFAASGRVPSVAWLAALAPLFWITVFLFALPSAAIVLSVLWPVTRRGTRAGGWICMIAGAATGIAVSPLASPGGLGAGWMQMGVFAATGATLSGLYLLMARRHMRAGPTRAARASFRHRLPQVS
ncbi:MAG: hypothetical protein J7500_10435 [Sphingomonas sp.]|uniref:hypothetical protein n=1 Tax=Sphingomonas sp. TaxID=28214 RepID=UPI001B21D751|nr:hypothetical protein [Sphingomonas sp.]MBO9623116.1 hypothetical protein [Sphingomonas sp.]